MKEADRIDVIQCNGGPIAQFVGASFTKKHMQSFLGRLKRGEILMYDFPSNIELSTCDITDLVESIDESLQRLKKMRINA